MVTLVAALGEGRRRLGAEACAPGAREGLGARAEACHGITEEEGKECRRRGLSDEQNAFEMGNLEDRDCRWRGEEQVSGSDTPGESASEERLELPGHCSLGGADSAIAPCCQDGVQAEGG